MMMKMSMLFDKNRFYLLNESIYKCLEKEIFVLYHFMIESNFISDRFLNSRQIFRLKKDHCQYFQV